MVTEEVKVETFDAMAIEAQDRASIDVQVSTAKAYPRNLVRAKENIIAIVQMDEETAKSCSYSLPRDGKNITGASVHLARIIAQQYGNIRIDSKIINIDRTHVTGQATCIDLENNIGIRVEVKTKISKKDGSRYSEDMITVSGMGAMSKALRNAIFQVVPKPLIDAGYKAAQEKLLGDVSDENKLIARRKKALDEFTKNFGVTEQDILKMLGLRETTQIKAEELVKLLGVWQAIKDGDATVDEVFFPEKVQQASTETQQAGKSAVETLKGTKKKDEPREEAKQETKTEEGKKL